MKTCQLVLILVLALSARALPQQIGFQRLNQDLLKATIVIEQNIPKVDNGKTNDDFHPIGSGVLIQAPCGHGDTRGLFVVTANHVVPQDGDVYFRFPDKNNVKPFFHHRHKYDDMQEVQAMGWVRAESDDLAVTRVSLKAEFTWDGKTNLLYDVRSVELTNQLASYEDVSVGDDVYVVGCPSSIMQMPVPVLNINLPTINAVRRGIVSAKMPHDQLLLDAFVFPGNSGGPVFWKPAMGLSYSGDIKGPTIEGRSENLIGIILAYAPYNDIAVSEQLKVPISQSFQNSGLAIAVSASRIRALFDRPEVSGVLRR